MSFKWRGGNQKNFLEVKNEYFRYNFVNSGS